MFQEVATVIVDFGFLDALENEVAGTGTGDETRRVFVCVEVLQEAADGINVLVDEAVDNEVGGGGGEGEEGGALEEGEVGREGGFPDGDGDNWGGEIAGVVGGSASMFCGVGKQRDSLNKSHFLDGHNRIHINHSQRRIASGLLTQKLSVRVFLLSLLLLLLLRFLCLLWRLTK